ncbi:glutathione S-transferase [Agrobacterium sp. RC10-4-1]|nr:glutathione S-transferase [Agrobacterium sp. RC10-4-1]
MLTLFHAPRSRSTRIVTLLRELDAIDKVAIKIVDITRGDGSGRKDPKNPHPEGKVPLLDHNGVVTWESIAIIQYLTDLFPEKKMAPVAGDPQRGRYLSWLAWYAGVVEPVLIMQAAGISHPFVDFTFRSPAELAARLETALKDNPYLMGEDTQLSICCCIHPLPGTLQRRRRATWSRPGLSAAASDHRCNGPPTMMPAPWLRPDYWHWSLDRAATSVGDCSRSLLP